MRRGVKLAALLGSLVAAAAGCMPTYFGASVMNQSNVYQDEGEDNYDGNVYAVPGYTPAQGLALMQQHIDEQSGAVVIADFEHNGVRSDGAWDTNDHNAYFSMIFMAETENRCVVIITPAWLPGYPLADETEEARQDVVTMATQRQSLGLPTVITDGWRVRVADHPEYLQPADYVHLTDDVPDEAHDADTAYSNVVKDAVAACPS
jgi:hypothetical protein